MITIIDPPKAEPTRYDAAKEELIRDLLRAFDEKITDFELAYDGMKPDWIREKVHWLARNRLWTHAIGGAVAAVRAKYPEMYLYAHSDALMAYKAFVKVRFVKADDGGKRVICHMEHDMPMLFLKKRVEEEIKAHNEEHPDDIWEDFDWEAYHATAD